MKLEGLNKKMQQLPLVILLCWGGASVSAGELQNWIIRHENGPVKPAMVVVYTKKSQLQAIKSYEENQWPYQFKTLVQNTYKRRYISRAEYETEFPLLKRMSRKPIVAFFAIDGVLLFESPLQKASITPALINRYTDEMLIYRNFKSGTFINVDQLKYPALSRHSRLPTLCLKYISRPKKGFSRVELRAVLALEKLCRKDLLRDSKPGPGSG